MDTYLLDNLIEHELENTNLDFKKEDYENKKESLIKDAMAMANSLGKDVKRIILGVKDRPGADREFFDIPPKEPAEFENVLHENIEPKINFKYYPYKFKDKVLGVLEFQGNDDKPYMMRKDCGKLKCGDIWIRVGASQRRVTRRDLDIMMIEREKDRENHQFDDKVNIGFDKALVKVKYLSPDKYRRENLPSEKEKARLKRIRCEWIEKQKNTDDQKQKKSNQLTLRELAGLAGIDINSIPELKNPFENKIRIGSDLMGLPIYITLEKLDEMIERTPSEYVDEDDYYVFEECAHKINFYIKNDGETFLKSVKISFYFDATVFQVIESVYGKPSRQGSLYNIGMDVINNSVFQNMSYPKVEKRGEEFIVEENFKEIRHKDIIELFQVDLRIKPLPGIADKTSNVKYRISAENLRSPIEGSLKIHVGQ